MLSQFSKESIFISASQHILPESVYLLTKFNLTFLTFILFYLCFKKKLNGRSLAILAPLSFLFMLFINFMGTDLGIENTQRFIVYPLTVSMVLIGVVTVLGKHRTFERIFFSISGFVVIVGFSFVHLAVVNVKTESQIDAVSQHNEDLILLTFSKKGDAVDNFFRICAKDKLYCKTSKYDYFPEDVMQAKDKKGDLEDVVESLKSMSVEGQFTTFNNLSDSDGLPFVVTSLEDKGVERTVVDYNAASQIQRQSDFIVFLWTLAFSSFWIYGSIFLSRFHNKRKSALI